MFNIGYWILDIGSSRSPLLVSLPLPAHNDPYRNEDTPHRQRRVHPPRCDVDHERADDPEYDQHKTYQQELHVTSLDAISTIVYIRDRMKRAGGDELNY